MAQIPSGTISALIGTPPQTEKDYYIVKYLLTAFGAKTDPLLGAIIPPLRPDNYVYETRQPFIIAGMSVSIAIMILVTGTRLFTRLYVKGLQFGLDDLTIIPAAVS
jgi:hypothetical protein